MNESTKRVYRALIIALLAGHKATEENAYETVRDEMGRKMHQSAIARHVAELCGMGLVEVSPSGGYRLTVRAIGQVLTGGGSPA